MSGGDGARVGAKDPLPRLTTPTWRLYVKGARETSAVHPNDVNQGSHNDCFLVAAMAAIAQQHPEPDRWARDLIKDNGDGTNTVTFYERQADGTYKAKPVTVRSELSVGHARPDDPGETWPALIEKAYAKAYGERGVYPFQFKSEGGVSGVALEQLTGKPSQYLGAMDVSIEALADYQAKGYAITLPTHWDQTNDVDPLQVPNWHPAYASNVYGEQLTQWHVYYLHKVDLDTGTVTIHNPNSLPRKDIQIPYDQFQLAFRGIQMNPVR